MVDLSASETRTMFEEQKRIICELQDRLADKEFQLVEGEKLRKKLHNTILVCIFAYGQTSSGKTYTMMGRLDAPDLKGLMPHSLEQIFQTSQSLKDQGWKYKMQPSILEIYNETIRDLLSSNRSSAIDQTLCENGVSGKQYTIKHDANGNTRFRPHHCGCL